MNIFLRKDGRWEGRLPKGVDSNGKRKYKAIFGKTKEEVQDKMKKYRQNNAEHCPLTIYEIYDEWCLSIKHRIKESTRANYTLKANKHILPTFGEKEVDSLSDNDIYSFIEIKQQAGLTNRYIADMLAVLKSMFKYAVRIYHIFNPLEGFKMPKTKSPEITLLDEAEQAKLQEYIAHNQNKATLGVALSMTTGIRVGEITALQWKDIDLEKRILTVSKTLQRVQCSGDNAKTKLIIP